MDNYVEQMWLAYNPPQSPRKTWRVIAWILGAIAAVGAGAYLSLPLWYPYVSSYL